jgi:hypothetical protein
VREVGTRRFIIAHEMGHFFNERSKLNRCTPQDIVPVKSKRESENDANDFATELLMKEDWYIDFVMNKDPSIQTIREAAEYFGVSLSATAIRYSRLGNYPVAVIMVHNRKVSWSSINEFFPYQFVGKSYVNFYSEAERFFGGQEVDTQPHSILEDAWFQNDRNFRKERHLLLEQCLPMPSYNSMLVVVWEEFKARYGS